MRKNTYTNFGSLYWPSNLYLNLSRALTLDKKIEVIYATSAVLLYIFHTTASLSKDMVKSEGKCGDTSRT